MSTTNTTTNTAANNGCTLLAVFATNSKAQSAVEELERTGVEHSRIHIHAGSTTGASNESTRHEGGFTGWLKSLFGNDEEEYTAAYADGKTIVAVDAADNQIDSIADTLDRYDPIDLQAQSTSASAAGVGAGGSRAAAQTASPKTGATSKGRPQETSSAVPVVREDLAVGKRSYQRGGVRVYSRQVDTPVEENVRLRDERVYVDRQPADRPVTSNDLKGKQDQVIEVKEYAEEPVVEKRARVVEEVRVGKDVSERTETVRDSVRHTEVNVEQLPKSGDSEIDDADFRRHFQQSYGATGASYADYGPAYEYGYTNASDPTYRNRPFNEVESDLRTDYERRYPNSTWEKVKDSVRYGWDRVTGKA